MGWQSGSETVAPGVDVWAFEKWVFSCVCGHQVEFDDEDSATLAGRVHSLNCQKKDKYIGKV